MSVMAYDPLLVDGLRRRMRTVIDELAAIRSADPAAAGAVASSTSVRRLLEGTWVPALGELLLADPLGRGASTWSPTSPTSSSTAGTSAGTPGDAAWLQEVEDLAARRMEIVELLVWDPENVELRDELDDLDERLRRAAFAYGAPLLCEGSEWSPTALLDLSPYAAALVLRDLRLDDRTIAVLSSLIVHRWHEGDDHGARWPDAMLGGDNTGDLVFATLAARPAAATEFLLRTPPDELLRSVQFAEHLERLLLAGTSPAEVDETTAGRILRPVLEYLQAHELPAAVDGVVTSAPAVVAAAVGPWLPDLGPRADTWGWSYDDGDRALRWLVRDDEAMAALTTAMQQWQQQITLTPLIDADGRVADGPLRDLAATLAQVQVALRDEEVDRAVQDAFLAELVIGTAGNVAAATVSGGVSAAAADGVAMALPALANATLGRWGLIPTEERGREAAQSRFGDRAVDTAVIAITAVVADAIERGDLPADTLDRLDLDGLEGSCTPREVGDRLHTFVAGLDDVTDPATQNALVAIVNAFGNPLSDAQLCA